MTAAAFLFGLICGGAVVAILVAKSDRDELREREAWEKSARIALRQIRDRDFWGKGLRERASDLLSDEAGA